MREKAPEVEIIRLLRAAPGHLSGQGLSRTLGVSRSAVWKHIEALRRMGYSIEASPSKGYTLSGPAPFCGVEVASTLVSSVIGAQVHFFEEVGSTNVKAFELARAGAPEGAVVLAEAQGAGKGRIGRRWESPPGRNLYASVILRPPVAPQRAHGLTFLSAVAVAEAIEGFCGLRPVVKWPNDILLNGRKAAGILLEMDSETDLVHFIVAGIGVNVNSTRRELPEYIRETATSLREEAGSALDRAAFASHLLRRMDEWYKVYLSQGFEPVLAGWRRYFGFEGARLRVSSFGSSVEGVCLGVDDNGALLLRTSSGEVARIMSGDAEAAG